MSTERKRISEPEIEYWAQKFNCQPDAIRLAKMCVGDKAVNVEAKVKEIRELVSNGMLSVLIPAKNLFK